MKVSLLYCGNRCFFDGILISALSVAKHTESSLDVHLFTADFTEMDPSYLPISQAQVAALSSALREKNGESSVTLHDVKEPFVQYMGSSVNLGTSYTPYTLLRLIADKIDLPDRILYLDADTAALGDVETLFTLELDGYDFAGARDNLGRIFIGRNYINSGVLLLNLGRLRQNGGLEEVRLLCNRKKWSFPDQDALNHSTLKRRYLAQRFNEQKKEKTDTVIRHFSKTIRWFPIFHTVNVKPWQIEELHRVYDMHALDDILEEYRVIREAILRKGDITYDTPRSVG